MGGMSPAACLQAKRDGLDVHCEELEAGSDDQRAHESMEKQNL